MPRYYIKFSGSAWDISGETPEAAVKSIGSHLECYATISAYEIRKDVDELGWPITPEVRGDMQADKEHFNRKP